VEDASLSIDEALEVVRAGCGHAGIMGLGLIRSDTRRTALGSTALAAALRRCRIRRAAR
jgi:hypothetical protein